MATHHCGPLFGWGFSRVGGRTPTRGPASDRLGDSACFGRAKAGRVAGSAGHGTSIGCRARSQSGAARRFRAGPSALAPNLPRRRVPPAKARRRTGFLSAVVGEIRRAVGSPQDTSCVSRARSHSRPREGADVAMVSEALGLRPDTVASRASHPAISARKLTVGGPIPSPREARAAQLECRDHADDSPTARISSSCLARARSIASFAMPGTLHASESDREDRS